MRTLASAISSTRRVSIRCVVSVFCVCFVFGCRQPVAVELPDEANQAQLPDGMTLQEAKEFRATWLPAGAGGEVEIRTLCAGCHSFPEPTSLPRKAWHHEVEKAYRFVAAAKRDDWAVPDLDDTIQWYEDRALEWDAYTATMQNESPPTESDGTALGGFRRISLRWPRDEEIGSISAIHSVTNEDGRIALLSDMATGSVWSLSLPSQPIAPISVAQLSTPCHIAETDLNQDGERDYLVANLGRFSATDHSDGTLQWCRPVKDARQPRWQSVPIFADVGRIADARPIDVDRDGDQDVIVAEFGFVETGGIHLLRNNGLDDNGIPRFESQQIDDRYGTVHAPIADLNQDGWPDFVALITQDHELVEAFINDQNGGFQRERIAKIENPSFGFSGLSLVDLDNDGDLDALTTNGDTLDSGYPSQEHGLTWWRNDGSYPFARVDITRMPGCYAAKAIDFDADGDLDVVVTAYLDWKIINAAELGAYPSVLWMEQTSTGIFERHVLEYDSANHVAVEVLDWDGDGRPDILTGPARFGEQFAGSGIGRADSLTLFLNQL